MKKSVKKLSRLSAVVLLGAALPFAISACDDKTIYNAASEFYWSSDAGATYGNRTKEYEVGENVYMQLIVRVESNKKEQKTIGITLNIPYVQDVVSKYMDGQIITPEVDEINHITTYNFSVIASKNSLETNFVFRFIPTKATDITITLEFDDNVDPLYDKQNTITFIEPKTDDGTPED